MSRNLHLFQPKEKGKGKKRDRIQAKRTLMIRNNTSPNVDSNHEWLDIEPRKEEEKWKIDAEKRKKYRISGITFVSKRKGTDRSVSRGEEERRYCS